MDRKYGKHYLVSQRLNHWDFHAPVSKDNDISAGSDADTVPLPKQLGNIIID